MFCKNFLFKLLPSITPKQATTSVRWIFINLVPILKPPPTAEIFVEKIAPDATKRKREREREGDNVFFIYRNLRSFFCVKKALKICICSWVNRTNF